MMLKGDI